MDSFISVVNTIGEHYGLLPAYAIIISFGAIMSTSGKHLLFVLSIMAGVYVVMFQAFNLQGKLLPFDIAPLLPAQDLPLGLTMDIVNKIAAFIFVYVIGFAVYGLKRLAVPKTA
jgi:hypothetical protein